MNVQLNLKPTEWQNEVITKMRGSLNSGRTCVVVSGRQRGKTRMITALLLMLALQKKSTSMLIEPTIGQSARVFDEIKDALTGTKIMKRYNGTSLIITLCNGSEIWFRSTAQRDGLRGATVSGVLVLDEAAFMSDEIIQVILPMANVHKAPVLMCSTPLFASGYFYQMYCEGKSGNPMVDVFEWSLDKYDMTRFITPEQYAFYERTYSAQQFQCEILGKFITDKSFVFGDFTKCIKIPTDRVPKYMGIDWATGSGGDSTVVTVMNENKDVISIWASNNLQPTDQIKAIARMINQSPTLKTVMVEMNSIGAVYYDALMNNIERKDILEGFQTTNDTKRTIIENLITDFAEQTIGIIDDEQLIIQIEHYMIEKTKTGYTYNAPKGMHDDYVMSLAICNHAASDNNIGGFFV